MKLSFSPFYKRLSIDQQITFTKDVVKGIKANAKFLPLSAKVNELETKLREWEIANNEAKFGGKMRAIKKIEKGLTVFNQLNFLSGQVDALNYGRKGLVEIAGYNAVSKQVLTPISNTNVLTEVTFEAM